MKVQVPWQVFRPRKWGGLALATPVDGHEAGGADVEGVVLVILEVLLVAGVLVAGLEDLPGLLGHLGLGAQLQEAPGEAARRLVVLQLEGQVQGRPQS